MSKYNILFCDDEESILESYKNIIENNSTFIEKFNEPLCSKTFEAFTDNYISVKETVEDLPSKEIIDIAVIDVNFEQIKALEDNIEGYSIETLGIKISSYLRQIFKSIQIIFVTAHPSEIKKHFSLYDTSNTYFIEKQEDNLDELVEDKILEILNKKLPMREALENSKYIYEIDITTKIIENRLEDINRIQLTITNPKITNGNQVFKIDIILTSDPFVTLLSFILLSCYNEQKNKIEKEPKVVLSYNIKQKIEKLQKRFEDTELYKEEPKLLKDIFEKISEKKIPPVCGYDKNEAIKLGFGADKDCKKTCGNFLNNYSACPMNLMIKKEIEENKEIVPKDKIYTLRNEIKKKIKSEIRKMKDFDDYKWEDGIKISNECKCNHLDKDSIINCKYPVSSLAFVYSPKDSNTEYRLCAKPTHEFMNEILRIIQ